MGFQHPAQTPTGRSVSTPYTSSALSPPSFPSRPGSSILIDCRSKGSNYPHHPISKHICSRCQCPLITFDVIPDAILQEIFDFYVRGAEEYDMKRDVEVWITLAHVCRRWRSVVFQSSIRLGLQLYCTPRTPRDILDIWPPLPLIVSDIGASYRKPYIEDNIIAALEHNAHVCQIKLGYGKLGYLTNLATILEPFPELTDLWLSGSGSESILPYSFLGGSASRLRSLDLHKILFLGLPKLLLSTTHLVRLRLSGIPRFGYIPPEEMATSLSGLTSLESLHLQFDCPPPLPALEARRPPPPPLTRYILPSLTNIGFEGPSKYLEVILARMNAPRLDQLHIAFFNQLIFDTPQIFQFISRRPTLRTRKMGRMVFNSECITIEFPSQPSGFSLFDVKILSGSSESQLSSLEQICTSSLPPISTLEDLCISEYETYDEKLRWQDDVENTLWLDLLRRFVAVKNLYISKEFVPRIAPVLQELVGRGTTEVFPVLENIFLEGFRPARPLRGGIKNFLAARMPTSHPIAVSRWDRVRKLYESEESDDD